MGIISEIIGYPLGLIMWLIYMACKNYPVSIVLFALITKLILFPLSVKQQKSTAAMQAMQPKLEKLKKQYGNNQEKYNEETMKLYSEEGVNPIASCLPLFIQFPILYGIFDVVYRPVTHIVRAGKDVITQVTDIVRNIPEYGGDKYFETRPELYILKAVRTHPEKFSAYPDFVEDVMAFNESNTLFGIADLSETPTFKPETWDAAAIILIVIAMLSGVFQLIMTIYSQIRQKKMNGDMAGNPANSSMTLMLYIMPVFSVWIAFSYPAAIGFYWAASSFFSLIQQIVLNKVYTPEYVAKLVEKDKIKHKNKKKQGLMDRYQQMLAEQNGTAVKKTDLSDEEQEGSKEVKMSKAKQKEYESRLIREARRRQAEKYGEEYIDDDDED